MLRVSLTLTIFMLTTNISWAGQSLTASAGTTAEQATTETESQQFARTRVLEMARFLGNQQRFSVGLRAGYEVVQQNGQKIEFGERRDILVARPNHVRIIESTSHGKKSFMLFDGRKITMFDGETELFAQAPQPGDIDKTVIHFVRDLKMRLPLAPILMRTFADELQRRIKSIDYVESTDIMGIPAHHMAGRTRTVDFQVWIAAGDTPLPLRIVLNYPHQEGNPQFWANFNGWNLSPAFVPNSFVFSPPAKARQILFAADLVPATSGARAADVKQQGDKP